MPLRHSALTSVFRILALVCGIFVSSTATQASQNGGRLIVERAPDFGGKLVLRLSIDGKEVASIVRDRRYDGFISAGQHVLSVHASPRTGFRQPTSTHLTVHPGHTYVFTAAWESDRIVLRRSDKG